MGARVSGFVSNVAKTVAKGATTALGNMIPVVGPALAQGVNSLYAKGGMVARMEAGGPVPEGFKAKPINSAKQLIDLVKKFPDQAMKAQLSVEDIKEAVSDLKSSPMNPAPEKVMNAPAMKRGGMMGRGGESVALMRGGMSGQKAHLRGRGGGIN